MTTPPKHGPRRLGWRDATEIPELEPYRRTDDDIQVFARWVFLEVVARESPEVLTSLLEIQRVDRSAIDDLLERDNRPDEAALEAWAARWHLTAPWCLAHARPTWRHWQERPTKTPTYWLERDDLIGELEPESPPPSPPRPLKKMEHFVWLVQFQCLRRSYAQIGREAMRRYGRERISSAADPAKTTEIYARSPAPIVRKSCHTLAAILELPLRTTRRGRPKS